MKSLIIAIFTFVSVFAFAQKKAAAPAASAPVKRKEFVRPYGLAGCGLGSMVMGKNGMQISAATTNGTSWNQTFGISTGTLNCVDNPTSQVAGRMDQFILVNRSQLQGDVARGNGETIAAIGSFMGCPQSNEKIGTLLKANYNEIFKSEQPANELTDSILTTVIQNPELLKECRNLG